MSAQSLPWKKPRYHLMRVVDSPLLYDSVVSDNEAMTWYICNRFTSSSYMDAGRDVVLKRGYLPKPKNKGRI